MSHTSEARARQNRRVLPLLASVLLAIGLLATPLGLLCHWASSQLLDSQNFAHSVAPLANDAGVRQVVTEQASAAVSEKLDPGAVREALQDRLPDWLPGALTDRLEGATDALGERIDGLIESAVSQVVGSQAFTVAWERGIHTGHEQAVSVLRGQANAATLGQDGTLALDVGPLVEQVKTRLTEQGVTLAALIPSVQGEVVLLHYPGLDTARTWVGYIDATSGWLIWAGIGLIGLAVALTPRILPLALRLLAVALAWGGGVLHWAGSWLVKWAADAGQSEHVVQLLLQRLTDGVQQQLLIACVVAAAAGVLLGVVAVMRATSTVRSRQVKALVVSALVLAGAVWLMLGAGLTWAPLVVVALAAAIALSVLHNLKDARPHR